MDKSTYRFAVINKEGLHSLVWRVWTQGNDCYIGSRGVCHMYKASCHEGGQCQIGLSSEIRRTLTNDPGWCGKSRLYDKWITEATLEPGQFVKLIEIVIPNSQLDKFDVSNKKVEWLDCKEDTAASIAIFKANVKLDQKVLNYRELARLPLKNGYFIIVLFWLIGQKPEYNDLIRNTVKDLISIPLSSRDKTYRGCDLSDLNRDRADIRVMRGFNNEDGRYWIEGSFRKNI